MQTNRTKAIDAKVRKHFVTDTNISVIPNWGTEQC